MLPFRAGQLQRYTTNTDLYSQSDGFDHEDIDALFGVTSSTKSLPAANHSKAHAQTLLTTSKSTKRVIVTQPERWWHSLEDVDPISLEPLAEMTYPPFQLKCNDDSSNEYVVSIKATPISYVYIRTKDIVTEAA